MSSEDSDQFIKKNTIKVKLSFKKKSNQNSQKEVNNSEDEILKDTLKPQKPKMPIFFKKNSKEIQNNEDIENKSPCFNPAQKDVQEICVNDLDTGEKVIPDENQEDLNSLPDSFIEDDLLSCQSRCS